jgi:DNA-binding PadR family transcriptional regulator
MAATDTSVLGYALLGLIHLKPSSGYDLRKTFAESAMGNYSSSPGAIYPALERLESQGLIRGVVEETAGLRRRRLYHLTSKGDAELKKWLARPIEPTDVMRGTPELMLRFSFMDQALGSGATIAFLIRFRSALKSYLFGLESYLRDNAPKMTLSGRLALECGIRGYHGLNDWANYAASVYRKSQTPSTSRSAKNRKGGSR